MIFGYARVSTQDQNLDLQRDALNKAGVEKIFEEKMSGSVRDRPELNRLMEQLRKGDTLAIWKLDRLGRSLRHLIDIVTHLDNIGVELISIQDSVNTSTPAGKLTFAIFGAIAEFERASIRERSLAGLAAARARGKVGGRKNKLDDGQVQILHSLSRDNTISVDEICNQFQISRGTYYNYLKRAKA
ncbi:MAG: recombinase family protein [Candidatus Cloacimonetes bacterium]|jgi:DNA invertase Pin-like site-specific DNA recombinase|nr:recombinase family protein [Candidatus Cloacimonadota bacterium]